MSSIEIKHKNNLCPFSRHLFTMICFFYYITHWILCLSLLVFYLFIGEIIEQKSYNYNILIYVNFIITPCIHTSPIPLLWPPHWQVLMKSPTCWVSISSFIYIFIMSPTLLNIEVRPWKVSTYSLSLWPSHSFFGYWPNLATWYFLTNLYYKPLVFWPKLIH